MLPPACGEMYVAWNAIWQYISPQADANFTTRRNKQQLNSNLIWPQAGQWVYDSFEDPVKRVRITATTEAGIYTELDNKQKEIIQALNNEIKKKSEQIKAMKGKAQTFQHSLTRAQGMTRVPRTRKSRYTLDDPPPCWSACKRHCPQRSVAEDGYCSN